MSKKVLKLPLSDGSGYAKVDYSCLDLSNMFKVINNGQVVKPADSDHVAVIANVPSGYSFLCWLQTISVGSVNFCYLNEPILSQCILWTDNKTDKITFNTYFLAIKN